MLVGEWLAELQVSGLSASRIRKAYRVLSLAMDAAVRERLLQRNPCGKHHRLPRLPEHDPTVLTVEQVEALIAHLRDGAPPRGKDRSGAQPIRPNPSLALIVAESVTEIAGNFAFGPTKTHQVRDVPLPRSLIAELEQHLDENVEPTIDALLFRSATGGPVRYRSLRRSFDAACRRLGHARSSVTTRHYARPMAGGDRTVADRLEQARLAARQPETAPAGAAERARTGHESKNDHGVVPTPDEANRL